MDAESVKSPVEAPLVLPVEAPADVPNEDSPLWLLVEDEGSPPNRYNVISDRDVLGNLDLAQNKIRYTVDDVERCGVMHLISANRSFVEEERSFMVMESTNPEFPQYWALVNHGHQPDRVRIIMVGCKKANASTGDPNENGFLLALDEQTEPFNVLHILRSEHELRDELKFVQDHMTMLTWCEEKDNEVEAVGLEEAYFLVQYYEDALSLVFTIVRYQDTMWKEANQYPALVAYIGSKDIAHQCVILRKSFDLQELTQILDRIRKMCNNIKYAQLHSKLQEKSGNAMKVG